MNYTSDYYAADTDFTYDEGDAVAPEARNFAAEIQQLRASEARLREQGSIEPRAVAWLDVARNALGEAYDALYKGSDDVVLGWVESARRALEVAHDVLWGGFAF